MKDLRNDTLRVPMVSVLMPVYNAERYLSQAIDSILAQTYTDLELVIQDDSSKDCSYQIALGYAAADPRINVLPSHAINLGEAEARNSLLAAARGKFITWLDADDVSDHRRLQIQLNFLLSHPEFDAVGTGMVLTDENLVPIERQSFPAESNLQRDRPNLLCSSLMLRAEKALATGPFRQLFRQGGCDGEWLLRFGDHYSITNISDPLYWYRKHSGSMSHQFGPIIRLGVLAYQATRLRRSGLKDPLDEITFDSGLPYLADDVFISGDGFTLEERMLALGLPIDDKLRLVSILIPFDNDHYELFHSLSSLSVQSFKNFEVIIFDNASSPAIDSVEINAANYNFPIRILRTHTKLRGFEVCQKLIDSAQGEFLLWQPAASYARNDRIESQLKYLLEHIDCKAIGTGINLARRHLHDIVHSIGFPPHAIEAGAFEGDPRTFMVRKSAYDQSGGYIASDVFPLFGFDALMRITPHESVHNLEGYMLQVYPVGTLLDSITTLESLKSAYGSPSSFANLAPWKTEKPIIVRLICDDIANVENSLDRLLPDSTRRWKNVEFIIEEGKRPDYYVVINIPKHPTHLIAPPNRVWYAIGEPPSSHHLPLHRAAGRGTVVLSSLENAAIEFAGEPRQYVFTPAMLPTWRVDRSYNELAYHSPKKTKCLSWVTSNLTHIPGHRYRMQFLERAQEALDFDLWGNGFKPLEDKWDGIADYKFSIAFENFSGSGYFSEKLMDCFVCETLPIYYGCTAITKYFPEGSVWLMDPEDPFVFEKITDLVESEAWLERRDVILEAKASCLNTYNMYIRLADMIINDSKQPDAPVEMILNPVII